MTECAHGLCSVLALVMALAPVSASAEADQNTGKMLFSICASCHGTAGQGNSLMGAPQIAGMPVWYGKHQLEAFADGRRGGAAAGKRARQMARIALGLSPREIGALAQYLNMLAASIPASTVSGDIEKGRVVYDKCIACHAEDGRGMAELGAPPLGLLEDWYIIEQLQNFRNGARGYRDDDTSGLTMRAIAEALENEEIANDLAAYINVLRQGD